MQAGQEHSWNVSPLDLFYKPKIAQINLAIFIYSHWAINVKLFLVLQNLSLTSPGVLAQFRLLTERKNLRQKVALQKLI